jgi:hypothetical protein
VHTCRLLCGRGTKEKRGQKVSGTPVEQGVVGAMLGMVEPTLDPSRDSRPPEY